MPTTLTSRLKLKKPDPVSGFVLVSEVNDNSDVLDANPGAFICTSTTRPATPFEGQRIYETDTEAELIRVGGTWKVVKWPASQDYWTTEVAINNWRVNWYVHRVAPYRALISYRLRRIVNATIPSGAGATTTGVNFSNSNFPAWATPVANNKGTWGNTNQYLAAPISGGGLIGMLQTYAEYSGGNIFLRAETGFTWTADTVTVAAPPQVWEING